MAGAGPTLREIARALHECNLEAILVGNAAALQGAPVTTLDFDFMFRKTASNLKKLKRRADILEGHLLVPYYPASQLSRLINDDCGLKIDFMCVLHGGRSFAGLKSRAFRSFGAMSHSSLHPWKTSFAANAPSAARRILQYSKR